MKTLVKTCVVLLLAAVSLCAQQSSSNSKSPAVSAPASKQPVTILKEPTVLGSGETWAVISWTTNQGGKGHSTIYAGTDQANLKPLDQTIADNASAPGDSYQEQEYAHLVRLNNLKPGTTYYFRADSGSSDNHGPESKSNIWTFTTGAPEPGSIAKVTRVRARSATVTASSRRPSTNSTATAQANAATQPKPQPGTLAADSESARLLKPSPTQR